jgi:hypothetical protein
MTLYTSGYGDIMPMHAIPNIKPFIDFNSIGLTIKIISGIIPSKKGKRHIKINLFLLSGYDAKATKVNLPFSLPIVTVAFFGYITACSHS